jgi:hypothetical protein
MSFRKGKQLMDIEEIFANVDSESQGNTRRLRGVDIKRPKLPSRYFSKIFRGKY